MRTRIYRRTRDTSKPHSKQSKWHGKHALTNETRCSQTADAKAKRLAEAQDAGSQEDREAAKAAIGGLHTKTEAERSADLAKAQREEEAAAAGKARKDKDAKKIQGAFKSSRTPRMKGIAEQALAKSKETPKTPLEPATPPAKDIPVPPPLPTYA